MKTLVQKWGNSLGIRIPSLYVKELDLKDGCSVEIKENDGKLIIFPKKTTLDSLLSQVTTENSHAFIDTGDGVGNEEW